jgi:hypothetical protein
LTSTEHQLGNRFLELPELRTPGSGKRDARSDLTSLAGLVLYLLTGVRPMTMLDEEARAPHHRPLMLPGLAAVPGPRRIALAAFLDRAFTLRIEGRWQDTTSFRAALQRVAVDAPIAAATQPEIQGLWTLHMVLGEPRSLFVNHRLPDELADFAKGFKRTLLLDALPPEVAAAASVLWNEMKGRAEIAARLPTANPFKRAHDHLSRTVQEGWFTAAGRTTTDVTWNRELEVPDGHKSTGPPASIPIASLTAAGQESVNVLDATTARRGADLLAYAAKRRAEWDA